MKLVRICAVALTVIALTGCQEKSTTEKAADAVNDALDRRPMEGAQDAIEDASDATQDATKEAEEAAKRAAEKAGN